MRINGLFLILVVLVAGCTKQQQSIELEGVEIREYEGKKLDSVDDFRENSIKGPQYIDIENYTLKVTGLVENPAEHKYEDIVNNFQSYSKVVRLDCVEGWSATILWEGMLLRQLIEKSKPSTDANTIIFRAYDEYSTSFPIGYIMENDIIMAYRMNNVTMPPERGFPFQLVAESKWGYKWIKWITEIELSDDENYKGYWERKGYAHSGELNETFFE